MSRVVKYRRVHAGGPDELSDAPLQGTESSASAAARLSRIPLWAWGMLGLSLIAAAPVAVQRLSRPAPGHASAAAPGRPVAEKPVVVVRTVDKPNGKSAPAPAAKPSPAPVAPRAPAVAAVPPAKAAPPAVAAKPAPTPSAPAPAASRPVRTQTAGERSTFRKEASAGVGAQAAAREGSSRQERPRRHRRRSERMAQNDPAPAPTDSRHSASSEDHESAASLNARAYRLQRRGHHAEAEPLLRRALEKDPNHPYAQYNLGWSLVEQGKAKEAVAPLEKTASRQPNRWEPQQRLAEAYEKLGEQDKAQEAYARARSLRGGRSGRYRRRGYSRHRDGEDQGDQGESRSTHRRRRSRRHSQPAAEKDGQDSPDAPTYVDEDSVLRKAPARGAPDEGGKGDDE